MSELIGGVDVVNALFENKEVEFKSGGMDWRLLDAKQQPLEIVIDPSVLFRLKPRTIKLEIEVPAPFEPKVGEDFFVIETGKSCGFLKGRYREDSVFCKKLIQFGAWKNEEEIKIVVEQLRKLGALK